MPQDSFRVVIDTNTLLRGLVSRDSAAARIRRAAENRTIIPLLSKPVLNEYRAVLTDVGLVERFPEITPTLVQVTIRRLRFIGDYVRLPKVHFEFRRDTGDEKFIELAISLSATQIISSDKDLLSLPLSHNEDGNRFRRRLPGVEVIEAGTFLKKYGARLHID